MKETEMVTMTASSVTLSSDLIEAFAATVRGEILTSADDSYDEHRSIWNAMIDRRPGLIVRCAGCADVIRAVHFAREHGLLTTVRGAGHNIAGNSLSDGGMLIDLSPMKSVRIAPQSLTARVEPGVTLGEFDREAQQFGLATPVGINSTTGIAGLTLGGGFGWLSRKWGLTADNLISADVVTAEGELVTASASENADLFWGLCGGGGNFGIVTSFEFAMHRFGPEVLSGLIVHPLKDAPAVLRYYREFAAAAPDDLSVWVVMRKAPPLPFLPPEVHGTEVLILAVLYSGAIPEGERILQPLRDFGSPHADVIGPHDYCGFQSAFDPLLTPGMRNYWKSNDFTQLDDGLLDVVVDAIPRLPSDHTEVFIAQMGGATSRVPADATAYHHRDARFILNVHGRWEDAKDDNACVSWCRELFDASAPFATGGVYVNFMTEEEGYRVRDAYGAGYDRLVALKNKYDPQNFFRSNQNIQPNNA
ncbi:MAG: FAD-binding oxidoreductase [Bacteroidota bacterium]|nr:FAD-binding oxidoreductase [Bacteroidota bacterium]